MNEKRTFISQLTDLIERHAGQKPIVSDSYYITRKSIEGLNTFDIVVQLVGTFFSIWSIAMQLIRGEGDKKASVFIERNDGLYFRVTDGMNENDVRNLMSMSVSNQQENDSVENESNQIISADVIEDDKNESID